MLFAYTRPRYQVSVFQDHWSFGWKISSEFVLIYFLVRMNPEGYNDYYKILKAIADWVNVYM